MRLSVVIPAHNEAASVADVVRGVAAALGDARELEIIVVDDGSTDRTWAVIETLAAADARVGGVRLRRRLGKANALRAGLEVARGDVIVTLDADGQDDPAEIPALLAALAQGADVVNGWKVVRHDPPHRRVLSRLFNVLVRLATGSRLHDHNCGLKAMRAEVLHQLPLYGDLHRFIAALAAHQGFVVREVPVKHHPRRYGRSKYGARVTALFDLLLVKALLAFDGRSHQLLGAAGACAFVVGGGALAYLAWTWIARFVLELPFDYQPVAERPLTFYALATLLLGTQLLSLAWIAGLVTYKRETSGAGRVIVPAAIIGAARREP